MSTGLKKYSSGVRWNHGWREEMRSCDSGIATGPEKCSSGVRKTLPANGVEVAALWVWNKQKLKR